ncbi:hypothetical protein DMENIID0001_012300 [Sergentomyia squamirostris]
MGKNLDIFLLKHRIFMLKYFYQEKGDLNRVKSKYEKRFRRKSPKFSDEALDEIVNLFENTGSVFSQERSEESEDYSQFEEVFVSDEVIPETVGELKDCIPILLKSEIQEDEVDCLSDDFPSEELEYLDESLSESGRMLETNVEGKDVHACDLCGKGFTEIQSFLKHKITHTCNLRRPPEVDETARMAMKKRFYEKLQKSRRDLSVNNKHLSKEKYKSLIDEVLQVQTLPKTGRRSWLLRRFSIQIKEERKKLIIPVKDTDTSIRYYIADDELFEALWKAHIAIGHGGRDRMIKELSTNYANITRPDIELFLRLCDYCQKVNKGKKRKREL